MASQASLAKKLGIKPQDHCAILYAPRGYTTELSKGLAAAKIDVKVVDRLGPQPLDVIQAFYIDQKTLKADLRKLRTAIKPSGKAWICWKKGNATELHRDLIAELSEAVALETVGSCAIDEEWSGLKLMLPKKERSVK